MTMLSSRMLFGFTIVLHIISRSEIDCKEVDMGLLEEESQVDSGLLEGFEVLGGDGGPQFERLVDGEDAGEGKHPWHVGLVREESKTGVLGWIRHLGGLLRTTTYCGATLVSDRWLLTAAHCIRKGDRPVDLRVVMGSSKRASYFYYWFQTDSIDEIHVHPSYNNDSHGFDIALLRLKVMPELEPGEIWPVCLPTQEVESYDGTKATVIGWGKTEGGSKRSSAKGLQELSVNVISQAECQKQWSFGKGRVEIGGPKMCFRSEGASCHGDSGGGMYISRNETGSRAQQSIIGVCSYGLADCQNWAPEVYTKVATVLDWLRELVGSDNYNMENCGVTTTREQRLSWQEMGRRFIAGRQVWKK